MHCTALTFYIKANTLQTTGDKYSPNTRDKCSPNHWRHTNSQKTTKIQGNLWQNFPGKHLYKNSQESKKPKRRDLEQNFKEVKK